VTRHVVWSRDALDDLKAQVAYIATENPDAAGRVAIALRAAGTALATIPTGRPGRVTGTYEKSVPHLPYIIAYMLTADDTSIAILRIIHTARDWPTGQWPQTSSACHDSR
jgi:toxin ParE1/3/4